MTDELMILAQTAPSTQPAPPTGMEILLKQFMPIFLIIGVFWWWMARSRKKERERFDSMLGSLKRNDRVQTIGGMLGTVVEVRGNDVLLKVDEASNVKIHFVRGAIKEVIRDTPESAPPG